MPRIYFKITFVDIEGKPWPFGPITISLDTEAYDLYKIVHLVLRFVGNLAFSQNIVKRATVDGLRVAFEDKAVLQAGDNLVVHLNVPKQALWGAAKGALASGVSYYARQVGVVTVGDLAVRFGLKAVAGAVGAASAALVLGPVAMIGSTIFLDLMINKTVSRKSLVKCACHGLVWVAIGLGCTTAAPPLAAFVGLAAVTDLVVDYLYSSETPARPPVPPADEARPPVPPADEARPPVPPADEARPPVAKLAAKIGAKTAECVGGVGAVILSAAVDCAIERKISKKTVTKGLMIQGAFCAATMLTPVGPLILGTVLIANISVDLYCDANKGQ